MAAGIVSHLQAAAGSSAQLAIVRRFRLARPGVLDRIGLTPGRPAGF
jgi:hypothetical protein